MRQTGRLLVWAVLLATAIGLRCAGLFRGLDEGHYFHPDEPKQVAALGNYLQGRYVWYVGSPFYDGYPYALNHVDEWVLRPVLAGAAAWRTHLDTPVNAPVGRETDLLQLTYWARGLRVLYGVLCVVLAYGVVRLCGLSRRVGLGAALLVAVSPLSAAVAHTASGDVGTDLFVGLALLVLCLYARRDRLVWLFASGALVGGAFACKYNGALGGVAVALFVAWEAVDRRSIRRFVARGATAFGGFLVGAVLMTPAFFINARQTWRDIRTNFRFIQEYGASETFLAKPFPERVALSWQWHGPRLLHAVTAAVAVLAAVGVGVAVWRAVRGRKTDDRRRLWLRAVLFAWPFLAVVVSMTGKPEVQPFHFSYLQLPLAVAAAYGLGWLGSRRKPPARLVAAGLLVWTAAGLWRETRDEQFYWKRTDNAIVARDMPGTLLREDVPDAGWGRIRRIDLEPDNPSVFRNRKHSVMAPLADFWKRVPVPPTPCVPYPGRADWIFLNGPLFARNDRMLQVLPGRPEERHLVLHGEKPPSMRIGLRTGHLPAAVDLSLGGARRRFLLPPDSQVEAALEPQDWRGSRTRSAPGEPLVLVPLRAAARMGPVWVTVFANEAERLRYHLFGGEAAGPPGGILPADVGTEPLARNLGYGRFLDSGDAPPVRLAADASDDRRSVLLRSDRLALPAGAYTLTCRMAALSESAEVSIAVKDPYRFAGWPASERRVRLGPGIQDIRADFSKAFAPYACRVEIACLQGACELRSWSLQPDYPAMTADLQTWQNGGDRPSWLRRFPAGAVSPQPEQGIRAVFGGCIEVRDFALPSKAIRGESLTLRCGAVLLRPLERVEEYAFFVHLRDETGRQVYADGFEVWQGLASLAPGAAIVCKTPLDVAPGQYRVELGVWNTRTEKRLTVKAGNRSRRDQRKRRVYMGTLQVEE